MAKRTLNQLPSLTVVNDADITLFQQNGDSSQATAELVREPLLRKTNNLSDLDNAATARTNLGVDTTQLAQLNATNDFNGNTQDQLLLLRYGTVFSDLGSVGSTVDFDLSSANAFKATLTVNTAFTFSNPISTGATSFKMTLIDAGSVSITFPASVEWPNGTQPTFSASGKDILSFMSEDNGTSWQGVLVGNGFS